MALMTQDISIPLASGIDTKTDPKLVQTPRLLNLENAVFTKIGSVQKRPGYDVLSTTITDDTLITTGEGLARFDDELIQISGKTLYSYIEANDEWISRGPVNPVVVKREQVMRNSYAQTLPNVAVNQGISVYAWKDSRGSIRASVYDAETFTALQSDTELTSSGEAPRCVEVGDNIAVTWVETNDIKVAVLDTSNPESFGAAATMRNDLNGTDSHYDITSWQNYAVFAYHDTSNTITVGYLLDTGVVGSPSTGLPSPVQVGEAANESITIVNDPDDNLHKHYIFWFHTSNGIRGMSLFQDLTVNIAMATVENYTTTAVKQITAAFESSSSIRVFYEVSHAATNTNYYIKTNTFSTAGAAGTPAVLKRSVGLASKAFVQDSTVYVCAVHPSTLQASYFLLDGSGEIRGKMVAGNGGGLNDKAVLSQVSLLSSDIWLTGMLIKGNLRSEDGTIFSQTGVCQIELNFTVEEIYQSAQLGENLHIVGSFLSIYDGISTVESGFHVYPEGVSTSPQTSGGSMADGTYSYKVVYEWTDNRGQLHRSNPSAAVGAVVSGGSGSGSVDLTIPTLRLTQKTSPRAEVSLAVYRTVASGTIYYRVSSITSPTFNDPTVDAVTSFTDTLADASITSNELLYTTGGVVENIAPPACSSIAAGKGRVFLTGLEDPYEAWYSKQYVQGEPVNFNDTFKFRVDQKGGEIVGSAIMDEKYIAFVSNGVYWISGDGPLDTGEQNTFTEPEFVPSNVGLSDTNSIVVFSGGLIFKADKGFHLLDRGMNVSYIGAPVEAYNSFEVTSANLIESVNEIRWTLRDGPTIVFNYFNQQWAVFTEQEGQDAVIWDGRYCYLKDNGVIYKENPDMFRDNADPFKMVIETAWIKVSSIQNFQRVKRVSFLGNFKSDHKLRIQMAYDYSDIYTEQVVWDAGSVIAGSYYGSDDPYGEADVIYGTEEDNVYQLDVHMPRQKCQAVKFKIDDIDPQSTYDSYDLTHIQLTVGLKQGLMKQKTAKQA